MRSPPLPSASSSLDVTGCSSSCSRASSTCILLLILEVGERGSSESLRNSDGTSDGDFWIFSFLIFLAFLGGVGKMEMGQKGEGK